MDDGEGAEEGEIVAPDADRRYGWIDAWSSGAGRRRRFAGGLGIVWYLRYWGVVLI
jgi:hypothetical protein